MLQEGWRNDEGSQGWKDEWSKGSGFRIHPFILAKTPFLGSALPRAHSGHSPKALHARTAAEKTPANAPASIWGGKWANPAEQTTAQGFAFVFTALNEAVSLLGSG